ncbi:MAG: Gfo/Idh/MocA family oxidoreductase [Candidatus Hydrogenedentes bacterium]|nr:Gfo/Idh/MocA family oxidoreductase [Candidatus Hydrogenedentota bacterium]
MEPATLRAAVIGAGQISAEHLRFLKRSTAAHLAAVCDLSESLARFSATRYGADKSYTDHEEMLQCEHLDVVHVLTPPSTHCKIAADCLKARTHVIVEKPIATTNEEFRMLAAMAQWQKRVLTEDHNYRFNEQVRAIEAMHNADRLGDVREVDIRMTLNITEADTGLADRNVPNPCQNLPAGILHDLLPHLCYLALRFLPSADEFAVKWSKHSEHPQFKFDACDALVIGGGVHARLRFASHEWPDCFTLIVRGSKGTVETDLFQPYMKVLVPRPGGRQLTPLVNQWVNGIALARASVTGFLNKVRRKTPLEGIQTFLEETYQALRTGAPVPVTYEDMDRTMRLMDALLAEENQI